MKPKRFLKNVDIFVDPTFFGIFVCGPLQSLVVNVCTLKKMFVELGVAGFARRVFFNFGRLISYLQKKIERIKYLSDEDLPDDFAKILG